jgi:DNA-binding transcriptional LysR family regulator
LQIFIAVAERGHVTRAADALGLAPPSVSAAVASLEREFGTKPFHRVGRGIALTEGGKLLLDEARALVNHAGAVKLAMREFTGLSRGRLEIKASQTIASHFLPPKLVEFHQAYPGIAVVVSVGRWVLREDGSGTRAAFVKALDALGAPYGKLDIAIELPSNEAVLAAVLAGAGATVLSARVCANAVKAGILKCLLVSRPPRAFLAVQHADRYRSRAVSALLEILRTRAAL